MKTILTSLSIVLLLCTLNAWADKPAVQPPAALPAPIVSQDPPARPHPNTQAHACSPEGVAACGNALLVCNSDSEKVPPANKSATLEACRNQWKTCTAKHIC